jgi:thioredoxin 1
MSLSHTTDQEFHKDVLESSIPVLIQFTAEWCGPCKMIGPILEELSQELDDKIKIVKVDVDKNTEIAVKYSIRSIPTLLIINAGTVKAQHIGAASKAEIKEFINGNI